MLQIPFAVAILATPPDVEHILIYPCTAEDMGVQSLRSCVREYYKHKEQFYSGAMPTTTAVPTTANSTTAAPNSTTAAWSDSSDFLSFWGDIPIEDWNITGITTFNTGGSTGIFTSGIFSSISNVTEDLSKWDTSQVTDFSYLFHGAENVTANLNGWDTSNVESFEGMFSQAKGVDLDLSGWDTSKVSNMNLVFYGADFKGDVSTWDTREVTAFMSCFADSNFDEDIQLWKTPKLLNADNMFENSKVTSAPIWETASLVTAYGLFKNMATFDAQKHKINCWQTPHLVDALEMFVGTGLDTVSFPDWFTNLGDMANPPLTDRCNIEPFSITADCVLEAVSANGCPNNLTALPPCTSSLAADDLCEWDDGDCGGGSNSENNCVDMSTQNPTNYDVYRVVSTVNIACPSNAEDLPVCQSVQDGDLCNWESGRSCGNGSDTRDNCGTADVYTLLDGHHLNMTLMEECEKIVYFVTDSHIAVGDTWIHQPDGNFDDWCPHAGNNNSAHIKFNDHEHRHRVCGCTIDTVARPDTCPSLTSSAASLKAAQNGQNVTGLVLHLDSPVTQHYPPGSTIQRVGPPAESPAKKKKKDDDNTVMIASIVGGSLVAVVGILLLARKMSGNGADMNAGKTNLLL